MINGSDLPKASTQPRSKAESKEDRKARKQAIKEERKVRLTANATLQSILCYLNAVLQTLFKTHLSCLKIMGKSSWSQRTNYCFFEKKIYWKESNITLLSY